MTDPRDEALRACVEALEGLFEAVGNRGMGREEYRYYRPAMYAAREALATARAALEAPVQASDETMDRIREIMATAGPPNDALKAVYQAYVDNQRRLAALEAPTVDARADERAACIALVYGHAGSDNDAQRIVDAIKQRGEGNGS
jgi:hypothetical protein